MAMAITVRMVARVLFFATEVTQGPLSSVHYTHIKRTKVTLRNLQWL
jgi:hypothetical protein